MEFLYLFIGWMVGLFISSFTIIQILTMLVFGFSVTKKLEKRGLLNKNNGIIKGYLISIAILSLIFVSSLYVVYVFFSSLTVGFFIGLIMTLVLGLGKIGKSANNISDYIQTNQAYFKATPEEIASAVNSK